MPFICAVCKIKHHGTVGSVILHDKFRLQHSREWTQQASMTIQVAHWVIHGWDNRWMLLLAAATNFLYVFNISSTMAWQGGCVQLEMSDMHLALNMAKMAKGGNSHAAMEEKQNSINNLHTEVQEGNQCGVEVPVHKQVKTAIEWHLAMVHDH